MSQRLQSLARLGVPIAIAVGAIVLLDFIAMDPTSLRASRGVVGPGFWPSLMLVGVAVCSVLWAAGNLVKVWRSREVGGAVSSDSGVEPYDNFRATLAIALVLLYGVLLSQIGFAFATLLFVTAWFVLGGIRKPLQVLSIGLVGTFVLVWFFVGIALMPLDLGRGVFEGWTVALYKAARIY